MGQTLSPRMAAVLTTAAGRPDGKAHNDGGHGFLSTYAALLRRGLLVEGRGWAAVAAITTAGRAAVADLIDAAKAAGKVDAAGAADLAHRAELARALDWQAERGDRVDVAGEVDPATIIRRPGDGYRCNRCGRTCRTVDIRTERSTIYGAPECEVAPVAGTLAGWLTRRADALSAEIDMVPGYPANPRWRVELARLRRLACEVVGDGPVSELAGAEVAELAAVYDRATGDYIGAVGHGTAGTGAALLAAYESLLAARCRVMGTPCRHDHGSTGRAEVEQDLAAPAEVAEVEQDLAAAMRAERHDLAGRYAQGKATAAEQDLAERAYLAGRVEQRAERAGAAERAARAEVERDLAERAEVRAALRAVGTGRNLRALPLFADLILSGKLAAIPPATLRPLLGTAGPVRFPVVYCHQCPRQLVGAWFVVDPTGPAPRLICPWCARAEHADHPGTVHPLTEGGADFLAGATRRTDHGVSVPDGRSTNV
jgi:hypothetical protein